MKTWFHDHDAISEDLTAVLNIFAAGKLPTSVVPLFTAGRGIAIPKNEKGELRPIVIGNILLRLIGSLAVSSLSKDIDRYFLTPTAIQFVVGLSGGCELIAAAITSHLSEFPNHVDISCDARNAFNSYSRKALWKPLHENFSSLYAFTKMVYGNAADIIFYEIEIEAGTTKSTYTVGTRQSGLLLLIFAMHPSSVLAITN